MTEGPAEPTPDWTAGAAVESAGLPRDETYWSQLRDQFTLRRERIYLNTGALGPSPRAVIQAVQEAMERLEVDGDSGRGQDLWEGIKARAAGLLGCGAAELAFIRNTTEGVNIVCHGLPLECGDEVITTTQEHVGSILPWVERRQRDGIAVRQLDPGGDADTCLTRARDLIGPRTRVLTVPHISCATGQVLPVEALGELAARHGLWYFVDGAQAPGAMPLDLAALQCHAYATSGHKWLMGPKGTGLLYVRADALELVRARWVGAYSCGWEGDPNQDLHFVSSAQRYEYGTPNVPLQVGLGAAVDFVREIGVECIWHRDQALATVAAEGLIGLGARLLSPRDPAQRSALITFRLAGRDQDEVQHFLGREYAIRTRRVREGGLDGIRVAPHVFNTFTEIERLLEGLQAALSQNVGAAA